MVRPASHTELRKRSQNFANKAGKSNPLKKVDGTDSVFLSKKKNSVPRWLFAFLLILLAGGVFFEIGQLVLDQIWPPVTKFKQPGGRRA